MGITFFIINVLYVMVIPVILLRFLPNASTSQLEGWMTTNQLLEIIRQQLDFIWLLQFLTFLYKVSPRREKYSLITQ